ncbi:MAG: dTMP kinase [Candidatus Babeliales bacterium]
MLLTKSVLIVLEGIDGSGKTVLAQNLYTHFTELLSPVLLTKEPGGSHLGKHIRKVLQEKTVPIDPKAEFLLFAADRAQHFTEVIKPAQKERSLIISDRMADSSLVYQGYGRGLDNATLKTVNNWAMDGIKPDLTLYVKIDAQTAQKRLHARGKLSAFDQEPLEFFNKLINGFEDLYNNRQDVIILDGTLTPEDIAKQAYNKVLSWIKTNNLIA